MPLRMLLVMVLLAARLSAPMPPVPARAAVDTQAELLAALLDGGAICHAYSGGDETPTPGKPSPHHPRDCGLCPVCHVTSAPALTAMPAMPPLPNDVGVRLVLAALPPATGPPARSWTPAHPRGPPTLRV
jgi:hypothetical protein